MKRITDKQKFVELLTDMGIHFKIFDDPQYIHGDGIKAGSKESIYVGNSIDLHFNKNGRYLGTSNDNIGSFLKRIKRKL